MKFKLKKQKSNKLILKAKTGEKITIKLSQPIKVIDTVKIKYNETPQIEAISEPVEFKPGNIYQGIESGIIVLCTGIINNNSFEGVTLKENGSDPRGYYSCFWSRLLFEPFTEEITLSNL